MAQDATVTWLTQEAYDRLAAELEQLSTTGREEIAKRIESAREEGDLKENGGYHAAKDEQGKQEARIRQLKELLRTAEVGEAPTVVGRRRGRAPSSPRSSRATKRSSSSAAARSRATPSSTSTASAARSAPSILGLKVGEKTTYTAPNGREIAVEITGVETWGGQ